MAGPQQAKNAREIAVLNIPLEPGDGSTTRTVGIASNLRIRNALPACRRILNQNISWNFLNSASGSDIQEPLVSSGPFPTRRHLSMPNHTRSQMLNILEGRWIHRSFRPREGVRDAADRQQIEQPRELAANCAESATWEVDTDANGFVSGKLSIRSPTQPKDFNMTQTKPISTQPVPTFAPPSGSLGVRRIF